MTAANWITIGIAAATFLGTWLTIRQQKTRDLTSTAIALISPLEARLEDLEAQLHTSQVELREQRKRRYVLEQRVSQLEEFLRSEGYDPHAII